MQFSIDRVQGLVNRVELAGSTGKNKLLCLNFHLEPLQLQYLPFQPEVLLLIAPNEAQKLSDDLLKLLIPHQR